MSADQRRPAAPRALGPAGRRLWRGVTGEYELNPVELTTLAAACATADDAAALEAALVGRPPTVAGSQGQDVIDPVRVELRLVRAQLVKVLAQLGIQDAEGDWDTMTTSQRARKAARARWDRSA